MNSASELRIRGMERVTGIEPALSAWESVQSGLSTWPDLRSRLSVSDRERPLLTGVNGPAPGVTGRRHGSSPTRPWAPPLPHRTDCCRPIHRRGFACTLIRHLRLCSSPCGHIGLDAVPRAYHNPAAVWWGAFAASAVIRDQVVTVYPPLVFLINNVGRMEALSSRGYALVRRER